MGTLKPRLSTNTSERRPSLKRKRESMDVDVDVDGKEEQEDVKSPKRSVTFSSQVEIKQEETKPFDEAQKEVRLALEGHALGDEGEYHQLCSVFTGGSKEEVTSPETLRLYTAALASNLSMMGRSCSHLVISVLGTNWLSQDDQYITLYIRLLGGLVSTYGTWLGSTLKTLAQKFCDVMPAPSPSQRSNSQYRASNHVHDAVRYILQLIPSASQVFSNTLAHEFPQQLDSRKRHVRYVKNLLRLREYAPELHTDIMALIVERLVKVDVQVQIDFEDLADEAGDELLQTLGELEEQIADDITSDDEDEEDDADLELDESARKRKEITDSMGKLDAIMNILFQEYSRAFEVPSSSASSSAASLLLSQFTTTILPTYRSRHTQFLLFHFMQTSPAMVDHFLGTCIHLILEKNRPSILRQSAAAYLASFVARGVHVPRQVTRDVFSFIGDELKTLRETYEPDCRGPDPRRYHTYYTIVQALLYIFCFRWRDLANTRDDEDSQSLSPPSFAALSGSVDPEDALHLEFPSFVKDALASNVFSRLNPLRVVAPMIATEFANTARKLSLLYTHHILEKNKRVRLIQSQPRGAYGDTQRETALSARKDEDWMCLDGYFPFDPYRLPASKHWVESDYRNWQGLDDDEEDSEDEDIRDDGDVQDEADDGSNSDED